MEEQITKDDLRQFGLLLKKEIGELLNSTISKDEETQPEWIKSRAVRKMMNMSAGTLQNLRITGKVKHKKVLGSYYYNRFDLENLFNDRSDGAC